MAFRPSRADVFALVLLAAAASLVLAVRLTCPAPVPRVERVEQGRVVESFPVDQVSRDAGQIVYTVDGVEHRVSGAGWRVVE